jgi:hypothetical protein
MPTPIPYKYYKYEVNGKTYVDVIASENKPYGYTEISFAEFEPLAKAMPNPNDGWKAPGSFWDSLNDAQKSGGPSNMVMGVDPLTGKTVQMTKQEYDAIQKEQADLASGALVKTGKDGIYVPAGSAALQNMQNPGSVQNQTLPGGTSTGGKVGAADGPVVPGVTPGTSAGGTTTSGGNIFNQPVTGKSFQQSEAYKALSAEDKAFVDQAFSLINMGTEQDAAIFAKAIEAAKNLADPYYKSKISLANAAVGVQLARVSNNYEAAKEIIERTQRELIEDVDSSKNFLSMELQAEIARESKELGYDLLSIADEAAEKGITFATGARSRVEAEKRREEQYSDVIQSSNREYNYKVSELEKQAARGDEAARKELEAMTKEKELDIKDIGRTAEEILGTGNLPTIAGYTPVGGVTGQIEEDKQRTLISDVKGGIELAKDLITF